MIVERFTPDPRCDLEARRCGPDQQPGEGEHLMPDRRIAPFGKPFGVWVSVPGGNPDWAEWCLAEDFRLDDLAFVHRFRLDLARVKLVDSLPALCAFHAEYAVHAPHFGWNIAWSAVAEDFAGVVIAPYRWDCRLGGDEAITREISNWYYGWDCASGCIWNPDALTFLESRRREPGPPEEALLP